MHLFSSNLLFWRNGVISEHAFLNSQKSLGGHTKNYDFAIVGVYQILFGMEM